MFGIQYYVILKLQLAENGEVKLTKLAMIKKLIHQGVDQPKAS